MINDNRSIENNIRRVLGNMIEKEYDRIKEEKVKQLEQELTQSKREIVGKMLDQIAIMCSYDMNIDPVLNVQIRIIKE